MKKTIIFLILFGFIMNLLMKVDIIKVLASDIKVITETYNNDLDEIIFDFKYPKIILENKEVEKKINDIIDFDVIKFKKDMEEIVKETQNKYLDTGIKIRKYQAQTVFEYKILGEILSIKMLYVQYTGGAHPISTVKSYNFDLNNGNILNIEDVFKQEGKNQYKDIVDKIILQKIDKNPENYFPNSFKGVDKNTQFYLTEGALVVFFQTYEIAPYSAGIPEFLIPYSLFKGNIKYNLK